MKVFVVLFILLLLSGFGQVPGYVLGQDDVKIVAPASGAAEGLDLQAVAELFKDSRDLEAFERSLNSSAVGVNNLDLNGDGNVDYVRVLEEAQGDAHLVILQAALGKDEFQDVATIEVEKTREDSHNVQVSGNTVIYGPSHYVVPARVHVHPWPVLTWMYGPLYRPYRSAFYFGRYPRWWRPYPPVTISVYRTRTVRFTTRNTFSVTRTRTVNTVNRVHYQPTSSTLVKKRTAVTRQTSGPAGTSSTTATRGTAGKTAGTAKTKGARAQSKSHKAKGANARKQGKARVKKGKGARGGKAKKARGKKGRRPRR